VFRIGFVPRPKIPQPNEVTSVIGH